MVLENKKILVVASHPDDEVLGCGGTLKKLSDEGYESAILILGEGATSRYTKRDEAPEKEINALKNNAEEVAQLLGAKELFHLSFPDNRFDSIDLLDIIKPIEKYIKKWDPQVIFTHHGGDLNIDHVLTHRAVLTATRPTSTSKIEKVYTFEIPSSSEWAFGEFKPFKPNTFIDITETLKTKQGAMEKYESEVLSYPHPRSSEALETIAKNWGRTVGVEMAEAFELVRSINHL